MKTNKQKLTILDMTPSEQGYRTVVESNGQLSVSYLRPEYGRKLFENQLRASLRPQEYDLLENSGEITTVLDRFEKDNHYFEQSGQAVLQQLIKYGKDLYLQDEDTKTEVMADELLRELDNDESLDSESDDDAGLDLAVFEMPQQSPLISVNHQYKVDWSDYDFDNLGLNRVDADAQQTTLHNVAMRLRKSSYDKDMLASLAAGNIRDLDRGDYVNYVSLGDSLTSDIHPNVMQNLNDSNSLAWSQLDINKDAMESALLSELYDVPYDGTSASLVALYRQPSSNLGSVQDISDDIDEYARLQHKGRRQVLNQLLVSNPTSAADMDNQYQLDPKYVTHAKAQAATRQPTSVMYENIKLARKNDTLVPDVANSVVTKHVLGMPNYWRGNRQHQEAVASSTMESMLQSTSLFAIIAKDMKASNERDVQRKKAMREARAKKAVAPDLER